MIKDIYEFNHKVLGIYQDTYDGPHKLPDSEELWLTRALLEEIVEFSQAQDVVGKVDALLDLTYFAIGGLARMGVTREQAEACFTSIHNANMRKVFGVKETRTQDGDVADAVKGEDFEAPEDQMRKILGE